MEFSKAVWAFFGADLADTYYTGGGVNPRF